MESRMMDISKLRKMVEISIDETATAREMSERDRDYYDGYQWTPAEISVLKKRKQPIITINRIKRKIDAMVGIEQRGRVDPRAYPRNPQDEAAADAATKALVFVDDNTRFDHHRSAAFENVLVEGYGGVEVVVEERRGRPEVVINRLRWEEIFYDPYSREKDFSDASYLGCMKWMTVDQAVDLYGDVYQGDTESVDPESRREGESAKAEGLEEVLEQTMKWALDTTFEDRPATQISRWADTRQKRVRIAQMYYRKGGVWHLSIFCGGGIIYEAESGYLDEDGRPTCPIILFSGYVDRENQRYGVARDMISAQDEINKRRSKLLHQLNSRQTIGVKGAVDSVAEMKRQLAMPDGHVDMNIEAFEDAIRAGVRPFEVVQNQDQTAGQFSLLQEAKSEIDMLGPNASLLGQLEGNQSGRAIQAQQSAGFAELAPIYDSLRDWTLRVYRAMWNRIRQFWTEERWIRITDDMGSVQFVGLNVSAGTQVVQGPNGMPMIAPMIENSVAEMDLDIIIEDMPDVVTLKQEEFAQLADMAGKGVPIPPEVLIEASSLRNKKEVLDRMEQAKAAQAQAMKAQVEAKMQSEGAQLQIDGMSAEARAMRDKAAAAKDMAQVGKIQTDTVVKQLTGQ